MLAVIGVSGDKKGPAFLSVQKAGCSGMRPAVRFPGQGRRLRFSMSRGGGGARALWASDLIARHLVCDCRFNMIVHLLGASVAHSTQLPSKDAVGLLHFVGWKITSMKPMLCAILMMSRRILPSRTSVSLAAMISRCQFGANAACGLSSEKQCSAK